MITLNNVNKYYNKGKRNEIKVINNTSLEFKSSGLVALLGPSGCGKTTLLNAIGGLDDIKSGSIYVNDEKISSKCFSKSDKIRNLYIGYIFQDYKLVENLSVFDNVSLVLKMIGIKDKEEINKRVDYVLDKVGMLRYKKRPCKMLSGGEKQRVGIARALVKDPLVILADEPTGNLDSKNSLEIMNIIKAISKEKLVLLVTHEQNLAKFYSDRIIEISDGSIVKDYSNMHNNNLDYRVDNNIYLKDFKNFTNIKQDNLDINIYSDNNEKLKLDIVLKNGSIYLKNNTSDKIEVIDEKGINFVNDSYKEIYIEDLDDYEYDYDKIINKNIKKKYSSIFNLFSLIKNGFNKVLNFSFLKKILLLGFFISGMFVMYAVSNILSTYNYDESKFVSVNKNYYYIKSSKVSINDYLKYEKLDNVNYILPGDSKVSFKAILNDYYQVYNSMDIYLTGSLSSYKMASDKDIIYGRNISNNKEILVDKMTIDKMFTNYETFKMIGITSYEQLLNRKFTINHLGEFTIVGITDLGSPSIYSDDSVFIDIIKYGFVSNYYDDYAEKKEDNFINYELYKDKITIKKGRLPLNDYEVILNVSNIDNVTLNKETDIKINNKKLKVVGFYESNDDYSYYFVNDNMIKYSLIESSDGISLYLNNDNLEEFKGLNIYKSYDYSLNSYKKSIKESNKSTFIVSLVVLLISLIEMYLISRSSFLSRIKEIGIYRAIGVKKIDIYRMFYSEIFAISSLCSLPGILFMAYIIKNLCSISYLCSMFVLNIKVVCITIIFVYLFNFIVGLLPVFNVIRKKPSKILSRNDLE